MHIKKKYRVFFPNPRQPILPRYQHSFKSVQAYNQLLLAGNFLSTNGKLTAWEGGFAKHTFLLEALVESLWAIFSSFLVLFFFVLICLETWFF